MSRGMRLLVLMLIMAVVVGGMMQCAKKTLTHKKPAHQEDGRAPAPAPHRAG
jgi:hypothetical protein